VKLLRLWLLVLLAVLLPVRGALAAAMVCAPAGGHAGPPAHHGHADPAHDAAGSGHAGHGQMHSEPTDTCNVCSASCSATPLVQDVPGIADPHGLTSSPYPDVAAAAATFLSDGQDRPPRSF
jgi:hypothetical protein